MANATKRTLLLLDWDGTITQSSTLSYIAEISPNALSGALKPFTSAYGHDYIKHIEAFNPKAIERRTLNDEIHFLDSLRSVEASSIRRLEASSLWKDVTTHQITQSAEDVMGSSGDQESLVVLRDGVISLLEELREAGGVAVVISVSWSATWIASALRARGIEAHPSIDVSDWKDYLRRTEKPSVIVFANEICPDGSGTLSRGLPTSSSWGFGEDGDGVWVASDKTHTMKDIIHAVAQPPKDWRTVYVGDSQTDLGCLSEAEYGVCMRDFQPGSEQRGLREILDRLGWICDHLQHSDVPLSQSISSVSKQVWYANNFIEIRDIIFPKLIQMDKESTLGNSGMRS